MAGVGGNDAAMIAAVLGCSPDTAAHVVARSQPRHYRPGQDIIAQNARAAHSWLLLAGHARARHTTYDGRLLPMGDYLPGDLFGAVLDAMATAPADVRAVLPSDTRMLTVTDLLTLMEQHAALGLAVSRSLLRRMNMLAGQFIAQLGLTARGRLCADLLARADGRGRIDPVPVVTQWALELNMARETLSRLISDLERRMLVSRDGAALVVASRPRLEALVI
jgi:CRP-like cAMP-binding protein